MTTHVEAKYPEMIIIILTYDDQLEHCEAVFQRGASCLLPKSNMAEDVVAWVQVIVSKEEVDSEPPTRNQRSA